MANELFQLFLKKMHGYLYFYFLSIYYLLTMNELANKNIR